MSYLILHVLILLQLHVSNVVDVYKVIEFLQYVLSIVVFHRLDLALELLHLASLRPQECFFVSFDLLLPPLTISELDD